MRARNRRSIYIADEQWLKLAEVAASEDRSVANVIRQMVAEALARRAEAIPAWDDTNQSAPFVGKVDVRYDDSALVPEPLGPDIRTTDEPVLPALKRIEGGAFHPVKPARKKP